MKYNIWLTFQYNWILIIIKLLLPFFLYLAWKFRPQQKIIMIKHQYL
ncbi:hypothetical protein pb186bvf_013549 [Paramecium bursaria]